MKLLLLAIGIACVAHGSPYRAVFKNDGDAAALGPLSRPQIEHMKTEGQALSLSVSSMSSDVE
jgi:hypothetical protein